MLRASYSMIAVSALLYLSGPASGQGDAQGMAAQG